MAIQKGIVKLSGKLGDLIFYSRNQKQVVRSSTSEYHLSEASRQSGKDFGEASKNAAYVCKAFAPLISKYGTGNLVNRMNKTFLEIFNTIPQSSRGNKRLINGNIGILKSFEFNAYARFNQFIFKTPIVQVDANGYLNIVVEAGEIEQLFSLKAPYANSICLDLMIFIFDLNGDDYQIYQTQTLTINLKMAFTGAKLQQNVKLGGDKAMLVAMGVHYCIDGQKMDNKKYFAAQIVESMHLKDGIVIPFTKAIEKVNETTLTDDDQNLNWELGI